MTPGQLKSYEFPTAAKAAQIAAAKAKDEADLEKEEFDDGDVHYRAVGWYEREATLAGARARALTESQIKMAKDLRVARAVAMKATETLAHVKETIHRIGGSHAAILPSGEVSVRGGIKRKVPLGSPESGV